MTPFMVSFHLFFYGFWPREGVGLGRAGKLENNENFEFLFLFMDDLWFFHGFPPKPTPARGRGQGWGRLENWKTMKNLENNEKSRVFTVYYGLFMVHLWFSTPTPARGRG